MKQAVVILGVLLGVVAALLLGLRFSLGCSS
jgi:hypothetical protein